MWPIPPVFTGARANNNRVVRAYHVPQLPHTKLLAKCGGLRQELAELHTLRQELERKEQYVYANTHEDQN